MRNEASFLWSIAMHCGKTAGMTGVHIVCENIFYVAFKLYSTVINQNKKKNSVKKCVVYGRINLLHCQ